MNIQVLATLFAIFNVLSGIFFSNFATPTRLISLSLINLENKTTNNQSKEQPESRDGGDDGCNIGISCIYPLVSLEIKYQRLKIESEMFQSRTVYRRIIMAKGVKESRVHPKDALYFNTTFVSEDRVNLGETVGSVYYSRNKKSEDLYSFCKGIIGNIKASGYHSFDEVLFTINCDFSSFRNSGIYSQKVLPDLIESEKRFKDLCFSGNRTNICAENKGNEYSGFVNESEAKNDLGNNSNVQSSEKDQVVISPRSARKDSQVNKVPQVYIESDSHVSCGKNSSFLPQNNNLLLSPKVSKDNNLGSKIRICEDKEVERSGSRGMQSKFKSTDHNINLDLSNPVFTQDNLSSRIEFPKQKRENKGLLNNCPWLFSMYIPIFVLALIIFVERMKD
ncbi:hypothetical protein RS030_111814 [Cryptosporidium xiaoi]|uniref:Uncharacterized protein n=1 Tax=Cryptosporidium xiaoi TaxID=659607 RepID=A0AAV9Y312_9CRYT